MIHPSVHVIVVGSCVCLAASSQEAIMEEEIELQNEEQKRRELPDENELSSENEE